MRRFRRELVLLLALGSMLIACGVPTQSSPTVDQPDDVPFGLLDEAAPEPPIGTGSPVVVYFLDGSTPAQLVRTIHYASAPVDLSKRLRVLAEGPTAAERAAGTSSALPPDIEPFVGVELSGGVADVTLDEGFSSLRADDQLLAIAQVVYTLTAAPGVGSVSFEIDGRPVEVPRGDGTLTSGAVSRDDYPIG